MQNDTFEKAYCKLNQAQKEAVDSIDGPVMVVAGPGTGKTQILTLRIANILKKTDIAPSNILALTFTESGAISMRRRLVDIIGTPAYSVAINTFHGFCNDIIKNYPEYFPRIIGSENITEIDQLNIIEEAISKLPLKELKPFGDPLHYVKDASASINKLKREGAAPADFEAIVKKEKKEFGFREDLYHKKGPHAGNMKGEHQKTERDIRRNEELVKIYKYYEAALQKRKLYDYTDMLMEVLRELQGNKNLLLTLQEQYQYILVDEHQDTNNVQNNITELLCNFHANPNIFVVGDEKQAIFRFQGASIENFLHFKKLYPKARLIVLEENYRSTQKILDSAHSLIKGKKELRSNTHEGSPVSLYAFSSFDVESYFLAEDIKTKIAAGAKPEEIAVIYRDNRDALNVMKALEMAGVNFSLESEEDALSDRDVRKFIILLRAVNDPGSDKALLEAMHVDFLKLDPIDVYRLGEAAGRLKRPMTEIIRKPGESDAWSREKINDFWIKFSHWLTLSKNESILEFMKNLANDSGLINHLLTRGDKVEKLEKLNAFFDEVKNLVEKHRDYGLPELIEYLDALRAHGISVKKSGSVSVPNRVRLMTAHRSKGQEFEMVYIVNVHDGHWGNRRARGGLRLPASVFSLSGTMFEYNDNDDERRLFYVALTRAKKEITLTYSRSSASGREQLPSQFIAEIRPDLIQIADTKEFEKTFESSRHLSFSAAPKSNYDIKDKAFIRELFLRNGLSVTALNNYLYCPWKFFYQNLLRIPAAPEKNQMYGIAIHAALKSFFDSFDFPMGGGEPEIPSKKFLVDAFEYNLKRQPMEKGDFRESLAKGKKALGGYYDWYLPFWKQVKLKPLSEFSIRGIVLTPEIVITGNIDKIEFMGPRNEINVVDYKTSKPKTKADIEGKTASSEGDIKRQLMFYNLLLNKYENGKKYKMVSGEIDFIEPDPKGRYKKEKLAVTPEEVVELETLIKTKAEEILNLSFWDSRCGREDCEYCAWREVMK